MAGIATGDFTTTSISLFLFTLISFSVPSPVQPASSPASTNPRGKHQALAAHGEVGDEVPQQSGNLHNGGQDGEDGGVELRLATAIVVLTPSEK